MSKAPQSTSAKASVLNAVGAGPTTGAAKRNAKRVNVPPSLGSINELFDLSAALSTFTRRYNELQAHMEFIEKSLDSMQNNKESEVPVVVPTSTASTAENQLLSVDEMIESSTLEKAFETMGGRGLRKYITLHLSDIENLREEATEALKRAPNPAKLVLDCIGRFYLQGRKAYVKDSPMILNRQASLLILEFLLLSGCTNFEQSVKKEAEQAAVAWRKRVMSEGGIDNASKEDARGLLLLVASYGIPSDFLSNDLIELVRLSNAQEISKALQQSSILKERIPDIIKGMVKKRMYGEAVEAAYAFGVEEQFPPENMLSSCLKDSQEAWERARKKSQNSPLASKEANEKQLASLKTVTKCLEDYKIDPMKFAEWTISDKIAKLEKENSDLNKVIEEKETLKRKADAMGSRELKHPRTSNVVPPQMHSSLRASNEQRAFGLANGQTIYGAGNFNGYTGISPLTAPSILGAPGTGAANMPFPGSVAGARFGYAAGAGGISHEESVLLARYGAGPYLSHGNESLNEYLPEHSFARPPTFQDRGFLGSSSAMGQGFSGQPGTSEGFGNRNPGSDLYQFADAVLEGGSYKMAPAGARFNH